MQPITPFLWFNTNAEAAVDFYLGIFPNASITRVLRYGKTGPGPEGSVMTIAFTVNRMEYTAINGGPMFSFSGAISFVVSCSTQEEVDHYWDKLEAGGQYHPCGWLTDKFNVTWQVVPTQLIELMGSSDKRQNERVMQTMMKMGKLEIAPLEQAAMAPIENPLGKTS